MNPGPRRWPPGSRPGRGSGRSGWRSWTGRGLLEELLAEDVIARALREAPPGHKYDRVLTAKMTVVCVLVACLFPGAGYDSVLATAFGLPGLRRLPGAEIPSGSAFSQARKLLGEQVMQRLFELDAAVPDADLGIGLLWKGLEVTAIDGTTMELARNDVLEGEFGTPADGARPLLRVTAHVRTATFRWIGAAVGGYHDGENALADQLEDSFGPGILNLADRGFFSMHRWIRFSAAGADLAWRVKNGAKSVPLKTTRTLPDGSELVMLHESDGMRTRRRKEAGDPPRGPAPGHHRPAGHLHHHHRDPQRQDEDHPDAGADHPPGPRGLPGPRHRRPVCRKMANRNRVPPPEEDRPRPPPPAARPVPRTGPPGSLGTAAHPQHHRHRHRPRRRTRRHSTPGSSRSPPSSASSASHVAADACCRHCGHRPASAGAPLASLNAAILALPRHRPGRQRTSGRTAAERRTRHTEEVTYTIDITKSNLPKWDTTPET